MIISTLNSPLSSLAKFIILAPKSTQIIRFRHFVHCRAMQDSNSAKNSAAAEAVEVQQVPGLSVQEMEPITEQTFQRYTSSLLKRKGKGVAIVWFRNDLRILDNEALFRAWVSSEAVLPVYCVDQRLFNTTYNFGFHKTGALRAQFLVESLADLKRNLKKHGLDLLIKQGKPEDILPSLAKEYGVHRVYAQKETCSEELNVERLVSRSLNRLQKQSSEELSNKPNSVTSIELELIWGGTMYHIDDLPFNCESLPDIYTQFRKSVESKSSVRSCVRIPTILGPPPDSITDWGSIPDIGQLGLQQPKVSKGMAFVGGESAAISRVYEYFWKKARQFYPYSIT